MLLHHDTTSHLCDVLLRAVVASYLELSSASSPTFAAPEILLISVTQNHPTLAIRLQECSTQSLQQTLVQIMEIISSAAAIRCSSHSTPTTSTNQRQNKSDDDDDDDEIRDHFGIFQVFGSDSNPSPGRMMKLPLDQFLAKVVKSDDDLRIIEQASAALIVATVRRKQHQQQQEQQPAQGSTIVIFGKEGASAAKPIEYHRGDERKESEGAISKKQRASTTNPVATTTSVSPLTAGSGNEGDEESSLPSSRSSSSSSSATTLTVTPVKPEDQVQASPVPSSRSKNVIGRDTGVVLNSFPSLLDLSEYNQRRDEKILQKASEAPSDREGKESEAAELLKSINNLSAFNYQLSPKSAVSGGEDDNEHEHEYEHKNKQSSISQVDAPREEANHQIGETRRRTWVFSSGSDHNNNTNNNHHDQQKRQAKRASEPSLPRLTDEEEVMMQIASQIAVERSRKVQRLSSGQHQHHQQQQQQQTKEQKTESSRRMWFHTASQLQQQLPRQEEEEEQPPLSVAIDVSRISSVSGSVSQNRQRDDDYYHDKVQIEELKRGDDNDEDEATKKKEAAVESPRVAADDAAADPLNDTLAATFRRHRDQLRTSQLQERTFLHWWRRTAMLRCSTNLILRRNFSKWRSRLRRTRSIQNFHKFHNPLLLLQRVALNKWRREFQCRVFEAQRSLRSNQSVLVKWRLKTRQTPLIKALIALRAYHLVTKCFAAWVMRRTVRKQTNQIETDSRATLLLRHAVSRWRRRCREKKSEREAQWVCCGKPLVRRVLERWLLALHAERAKRYISRAREIQVQKQALSWWRCRCRERQHEIARKNAKFEVVARRRLLTKSAFEKWKTKLKLLVLLQEKNAIVAKRVLTEIWRKKFLIRRHLKTRQIGFPHHQDGNSVSNFVFARRTLSLMRPPVALLELQHQQRQQQQRLLIQEQQQQQQHKMKQISQQSTKISGRVSFL